MTETRRNRRIFKRNNRSFILAMDHVPEINNPGKIIEEVMTSGADGILTNYGIAKRFTREIGDAVLLLRADDAPTKLATEMDQFRKARTVEEAVRIGADGVVCMLFVGAEKEAQTIDTLTELTREAAVWNMPVGAEALPRGFEFGKHDDIRTTENIAFASRLACDYGADFVKTEYTGDVDSFKEVVDACYKPVLILGGGSKKDDTVVLTEIYDSLLAGGAGVIMGRNILNHKTPGAFTKAINLIIHHDYEVAKAMEEAGLNE